MTEHKAEATLEEQLAALEAERDEYLNDLKRVAADFENYRKRAARDRNGRRAAPESAGSRLGALPHVTSKPE